MKNIHKNPLFYYIAVPSVLALWLLTISFISLPHAKKQLEKEFTEYSRAIPVMEKILETDPERLEFIDPNNETEEFDYASAIQKTASKCGISSRNYNLSSGRTIRSGDQKSQEAKLNVEDVTIVQFSKFLSTIQFRWPDLQCIKIKLTKNKNDPELWDIDANFKYYF